MEISPLLLTLQTTIWSPDGPKTKGREKGLGRLKEPRASWKERTPVCWGCDSGYMNTMFTALHEAVVGPTGSGQRSEDAARIRWFPQLCGRRCTARPEPSSQRDSPFNSNQSPR